MAPKKIKTKKFKCSWLLEGYGIESRLPFKIFSTLFEVSYQEKCSLYKIWWLKYILQECLIGPGPCIHDARVGVATCLADQDKAIHECIVGKKASLAAADKCLACAVSCKLKA